MTLVPSVSNQKSFMEKYTPTTNSFLFEGSKLSLTINWLATCILLGLPVVFTLSYDAASSLKNRIVPISNKPDTDKSKPATPDTNNLSKIEKAKNFIFDNGGKGIDAIKFGKSWTYDLLPQTAKSLVTASIALLIINKVIGVDNTFSVAKPILKGFKNFGSRVLWWTGLSAVEMGKKTVQTVVDDAPEHIRDLVSNGLNLIYEAFTSKGAILTTVKSINIWSIYSLGAPTLKLGVTAFKSYLPDRQFANVAFMVAPLVMMSGEILSGNWLKSLFNGSLFGMSYWHTYGLPKKVVDLKGKGSHVIEKIRTLVADSKRLKPVVDKVGPMIGKSMSNASEFAKTIGLQAEKIFTDEEKETIRIYQNIIDQRDKNYRTTGSEERRIQRINETAALRGSHKGEIERLEQDITLYSRLLTCGVSSILEKELIKMRSKLNEKLESNKREAPKELERKLETKPKDILNHLKYLKYLNRLNNVKPLNDELRNRREKLINKINSLKQRLEETSQYFRSEDLKKLIDKLKVEITNVSNIPNKISDSTKEESLETFYQDLQKTIDEAEDSVRQEIGVFQTKRTVLDGYLEQLSKDNEELRNLLVSEANIHNPNIISKGKIEAINQFFADFLNKISQDKNYVGDAIKGFLDEISVEVKASGDQVIRDISTYNEAFDIRKSLLSDARASHKYIMDHAELKPEEMEKTDREKRIEARKNQEELARKVLDERAKLLAKELEGGTNNSSDPRSEPYSGHQSFRRGQQDSDPYSDHQSFRRGHQGLDLYSDHQSFRRGHQDSGLNATRDFLDSSDEKYNTK